MGPQAAILPDGARLHLHHGPIDLVIGADGERDRAFRAATLRFATVLDELVAELPLLRQPVTPEAPLPQGAIARRMDAAVRPHCAQFVTRMAAVAGAVAETVLEAMVSDARLSRAWVNNGGDIALHLSPGTEVTIGIAGLDKTPLGGVRLRASDRVGGIATSGMGGRSQTLGIADSVTVLARTAASADAAATLIANAVDLPGHPAISRCPATDLRPDSDLGNLPVTTGRGPLTRAEIDRALAAGHVVASAMLRAGLIDGAALFLAGRHRTAGPHFPSLAKEFA